MDSWRGSRDVERARAGWSRRAGVDAERGGAPFFLGERAGRASSVTRSRRARWSVIQEIRSVWTRSVLAEDRSRRPARRLPPSGIGAGRAVDVVPLWKGVLSSTLR